MTAGFRVASLLMMLVLSVPMVRECCVPVTLPLPCHHQQPVNPNDATCAAAQTAIAETKMSLGAGSAGESICPTSEYPSSAVLAVLPFITGEIAHFTIPATSIYLRTGALLI
jgi:hypothetical protein